MKAITLKEIGSVENLAIADLPMPIPEPDEILIEVKAISINPSETYLRKDKTNHWIFGDDSPVILGWDVSGVVTVVGKNVSGFAVGDEVFGVIRHPGHGKAYAEYAVAPAAHMAHKPANVSHEQAAAATLAALTALQPIQKVTIKPGQKVLITGAGGGVGHFAVQLAKHFGAYVIALASGARREFVLGLGADDFIDYQTQRFEHLVSNVDLVIEAAKVDGHLLRSLEVVKPGGSLISLWSYITADEAAKASKLGVNAFFNMVLSSGKDMKVIAELLRSQAIVPHVSKVFRLAEVARAHAEIEKNHTQGKIVLIP
ncbi:MAG TPA: NADP-dependent oxidoreductase [Chryseolinea sp.]